ncbi:uncharacterized protein LOC115376200 [Myripristis murdjan]|uniref:uncharacterized protein LOC115376200 n=1 Tax=Myripristis murdjan TaxID=586833 RepID=UPI001175CD8D|nr:uncharacterized protein LOC115376200 [Myripristis murdjan]
MEITSVCLTLVMNVVILLVVQVHRGHSAHECAGSVVLESPVLPVTEGSDVTLRCKTKTTPSNLTADFYKNGFLFGNGSTGEMTIHSVSKSDEGFYKCSVSDSGKSPQSWLAVRALHTPPPDATLIGVTVVLAVLLLALGLLYFWKYRGWRVRCAVPEGWRRTGISLDVLRGAVPRCFASQAGTRGLDTGEEVRTADPLEAMYTVVTKRAKNTGAGDNFSFSDRNHTRNPQIEDENRPVYYALSPAQAGASTSSVNRMTSAAAGPVLAEEDHLYSTI